MKKVIVIGGGYTGLSAAYELLKNGFSVSLFEASDSLGGLAGTFEISKGIRIEKFYHHWFSSDYDILSLIKELGIEQGIKDLTTNTGLYYSNSIFRLKSPFDLLTFKPIPFIDRVRTGLMALKARRITDWIPLEDETAFQWILRHAGKKSFEVIWEPLLKGKFGEEAEHISAVWFWNKLKLRGSSRNKKGDESLFYFEGGFQKVTDALRDAILKLGGEIYLDAPITKILSDTKNVFGICSNDKEFQSDYVISTIPLPQMMPLINTLPDTYTNKIKNIRYLGNVCLILSMKKSFSDTYWLNVSDPSFPFVGIIEHTNLDPISNYGGRHIAYISKYLSTSNSLFSLSDTDYYEYCIPYIQKIFPQFSKEWVHDFACWRASYSQPVITQHYSKLIPEVQTPISNFFISSMAQIYPEDRGTNYAIREGRRVAKLVAELK